MRRWFRHPVFLSSLFLSHLALADCPELVQNGDFETGSDEGWTLYTSGRFYDQGVIEDPYNPGNQFLEFDHSEDGSDWELWDAGLQQSIQITAGATYRLTFWARGDDAYGNGNGTSPGSVTVAESGGNFTNYGLDATFNWMYDEGAGQAYEFEFEATASGPAVLTFFFGSEDVVITIDSIYLQEISSSECDASGGASSGGGGGSSSGGASSGGSSSGGNTGNTGGIGGQIHNNQLSYVSSAEKIATLVLASDTPQTWQLRNSTGAVVASGQTQVSGEDVPSGDMTHLIDFSSYDTSGDGYRIWVGDAAGPAFGIGGNHYAALRRDALRFFYYQRASEAISATYSEGSAYARAAGHTDPTVGCESSADCSYALDTRSGWYDAGDYGKYVVNGGIALWTLLNLYERTEHLGTDLDALGDSQNNIPESGNEKSDLLDEAKKEIQFMLGMQVPAGQALAGMAHHKVHGADWDGIPVEPSDALPHFLRPPSTAATLNLAATAAQCARIYKTIDAPLAADCLTAAEIAYAAALAHPQRLAPTTDDEGGGNYSDAEVSDEFYWAAAELFISTGSTAYLDDLFASEHHASPPTGGAAMAWPTTATLGMMSLAIVPSDLDDQEREAVRAALVLRAQEDLALAESGYGASIAEFYWGSNSSVLNASLLHAVAYDLTGTVDHRAAALAGLDYVLGRNPLGQSYVSGYGEAPFTNPHHRFWAYGFDTSWPAPPPGVLAGGPNDALDGLSVSEIGSLGLTGCAPAKCWADYAPAYSLGEVTINWNAPLAWLASWASELQTDPQDEFPGVDLEAVPGGPASGDGDGDTTSGDTDTTSGDTDTTSGDGDATSGDTDTTSGDGDATSGDTDTTSGDGDATTGDGDADCDVGDEGCACFPNDTCNDELSCQSNRCVADEDSGDSGQGTSNDKGGCSHAPVPQRTGGGSLAGLGLLALAWWSRRRIDQRPDPR